MREKALGTYKHTTRLLSDNYWAQGDGHNMSPFLIGRMETGEGKRSNESLSKGNGEPECTGHRVGSWRPLGIFHWRSPKRGRVKGCW